MLSADFTNESFYFLHMEIVNYAINKEKTLSLDNTNYGKWLQSIGFSIGQRIVEKISMDSLRLFTEIDIIKFICKEFWSTVFGKQVDNLKTNHQGVYVVVDEKFKLLTQISNKHQYIKNIDKFLILPCGIIQGALANLGIISQVTAEVQNIPHCKFTFKLCNP